ncbi:hypothetical protein MuYL_2335 [Mucilaginibacter xinganensis]|uniref:Uncharacterized protein n=1 Tax=Mucilaginibacter xinganensis TaxID=1234841 RepID=A0A223NWZ4_9SPHI|nr:hypothetical protein MuYL_2335 [Mucilaginibacter xinganensis]
MDIANEVFALGATTVSLSLKLFSWPAGKYPVVLSKSTRF